MSKTDRKEPTTVTLYEVTKFGSAEYPRHFEDHAAAVAWVAESTKREKDSLRELHLTPTGQPHYVIRTVEVLAS